MLLFIHTKIITNLLAMEHELRRTSTIQEKITTFEKLFNVKLSPFIPNPFLKYFINWLNKENLTTLYFQEWIDEEWNHLFEIGNRIKVWVDNGNIHKEYDSKHIISGKIDFTNIAKEKIIDTLQEYEDTASKDQFYIKYKLINGWVRR